jgi:G3E family GTPase
MPDRQLKEILINKIKQIDDQALLEEVSVLFELQEPETIYNVNEEQRKAIQEAKEQIKNKQTLSNEEANREADEWLNNNLDTGCTY